MPASSRSAPQLPDFAPLVAVEPVTGPDDLDALSPLAQLLALLEAGGPLRVAFEDLSGISYDLPVLALPTAYRIHRCSTCMAGKATTDGWNRCIRNKAAINRLATRRATGFVGQCHLGLTEIVEPLMVDGHGLGVFYYGQVRAVGDAALETREVTRRQHYLTRDWVPSARFSEAMAATPTVPAADLPMYAARLRAVVAMCAGFIVASGLPLDRYATQRGANYVRHSEPLPPLLGNAVRAILARYAQPLKARDLAASLGCHPDHLGRLFASHFGIGIPAYLREVRMLHARRLLRSGHHTVAEVADRVGYPQVSQFCRAFRTVVGLSPGLYAQRPPIRDESMALPSANTPGA